MNPDQDLTATSHDRPRKASGVFAILRRILLATGLSIKLKSKMHHCLVGPVALYGAKTWTLLPSLEHVFDANDVEWVRQIAGKSCLTRTSAASAMSHPV